MRNANGSIDWAATEARAAEMTGEQLFAAIADIRATLEHADAIDRATGSDNGGYYRDEASIYWREITKRREMRFYDARTSR